MQSADTNADEERDAKDNARDGQVPAVRGVPELADSGHNESHGREAEKQEAPQLEDGPVKGYQRGNSGMRPPKQAFGVWLDGV